MIGVVLLCHTALDRAAQVARFWAEGGARVVVHVDLCAPEAEVAAMRAALAGLDVVFCRRRRCHWGTWSLVGATQDAAKLLLAHADVSHVFLASGACLPLRPVSDLAAFLAARPGVDFIESATCAEADWVVGGLGMERFTLRFPFPWKTRRALFDACVAAQRRLRLRRKIPGGVTPHIGSQWWCLTRETLSAILTDPRRTVFDRYFRGTWIPDESYFQTLARHHARRIESRSLTFSSFDEKGAPQIFFDDHAALLRASGCFVARKIWPGAEGLYHAFLAPAPQPGLPRPALLRAYFGEALQRRREGRPGLYSQSRFPRDGHENGKTRGPYAIFQGFTDLFEGVVPWLAARARGAVHGHLFAPEGAQFAGGEEIGPGCLSAAAALRDRDPRAFLTNLLWAAQGAPQAFMLSPRDTQPPGWFVATDPNAEISVIAGAWAVTLFRSGGEVAKLRPEFVRLQRAEARLLDILRSPHTRARVRIWTLAEAIAAPAPLFDAPDPPRMVDLEGFPAFLRALRDAGLQPNMAGDFFLDDDG